MNFCLFINKFRPDIVHIHGTEDFYGLMTSKIPNPVVVSFQGVLITIVHKGRFKI